MLEHKRCGKMSIDVDVNIIFFDTTDAEREVCFRHAIKRINAGALIELQISDRESGVCVDCHKEEISDELLEVYRNYEIYYCRRTGCRAWYEAYQKGTRGKYTGSPFAKYSNTKELKERIDSTINAKIKKLEDSE